GVGDAVRAGRVEVVAGVLALDGREVVLLDGTRVAPDAVVAATGYRPALEPLVGHLDVLGAHGRPIRELPGLHFAAISVQLSGLLREAGKDGRRIAARVARELSSAPAPEAAPALGA